jgi:hypothetical protein
VLPLSLAARTSGSAACAPGRRHAVAAGCR